MRYLNANDLNQLVPDSEYCKLVEQAFEEYGRERKVTSQPSIATTVPPHDASSTMSMKGTVATSLRAHGVFFGVRSRDYYLAVCDLQSGTLLGVVEQSLSYKRRTAASAVVAAGFFAPQDAHRAAVIGSGAIATEVARLLPTRFKLDVIRVASRTAQGARAFVDRLQPQVGCPMQAVASVADAVADADIVITITNATAPFIHAGMVKRGSFLCSLGGSHEVDFSVLDEIDRLIVDDIGYALWRGDFNAWVDSGRITRAALEQRIEGDMGQVAVGHGFPSSGERNCHGGDPGNGHRRPLHRQDRAGSGGANRSGERGPDLAAGCRVVARALSTQMRNAPSHQPSGRPRHGQGCG